MALGNPDRRNQMFADLLRQYQPQQGAAPTDLSNPMISLGMNAQRPPPGGAGGMPPAPMGQPPPAAMGQPPPQAMMGQPPLAAGTDPAAALSMGQPSPDQQQRAQLAMRLFAQRR